MNFIKAFRLLMLALWLGAAVFFIGVAQSSFAVLPSREMAGLVVGRTLTILNYSGLSIAVLLILMSMIGAAGTSKALLWIERLLLGIVAAACGVGELVLGMWLASIRAQLGRPIDEVAADDPLKIQFGVLHGYSEWALFAAMIAAVIAFFIISNRKTGKSAAPSSDVYDFQKEFKI